MTRQSETRSSAFVDADAVIESGLERRLRITAAVKQRTGIDEAMIEALVRDFYDRVRNDSLLGPIFEPRIPDWETHIAKLRSFWSSVALMTGTYHGQPLKAHIDLPVDGTHFDRWLALFEQSVRRQCPPAAAAHLLDRARRIADSFEMGHAARGGVIRSPPFAHRARFCGAPDQTSGETAPRAGQI